MGVESVGGELLECGWRLERRGAPCGCPFITTKYFRVRAPAGGAPTCCLFQSKGMLDRKHSAPTNKCLNQYTIFLLKINEPRLSIFLDLHPFYGAATRTTGAKAATR